MTGYEIHKQVHPNVAHQHRVKQARCTRTHRTWWRCACGGIGGVGCRFAVSGALQWVSLVLDVHVLAGHFTAQGAAFGVEATNVPFTSCALHLVKYAADAPQVLQGVHGSASQSARGEQGESLGLIKLVGAMLDDKHVRYPSLPVLCSCSSGKPGTGRSVSISGCKRATRP